MPLIVAEALNYLTKITGSASVPFPFPKTLRIACDVVLFDRRFANWPGSVDKHHAYPGGLAVHTAEVLRGALAAAEAFPAANRDVITTAAIWHDWAKTLDYEKDPLGKWRKTQHCAHIRHLSASYAEWMRHSDEVDPQTRDAVSHAILAHHGRKEWGSPIEPQTIEALLLHSADLASAQFGPGAFLEVTK